jgi:hypothetical protein
MAAIAAVRLGIPASPFGPSADFGEALFWRNPSLVEQIGVRISEPAGNFINPHATST